MDPLAIVRSRCEMVSARLNKLFIKQGAGSNVTTSHELVCSTSGCGLLPFLVLFATFSSLSWSNGSLSSMGIEFVCRRRPRLGAARYSILLPHSHSETKEPSRSECSCEFDDGPEPVKIYNSYFSSYPAVYIITVGGFAH